VTQEGSVSEDLDVSRVSPRPGGGLLGSALLSSLPAYSNTFEDDTARYSNTFEDDALVSVACPLPLSVALCLSFLAACWGWQQKEDAAGGWVGWGAQDGCVESLKDSDVWWYKNSVLQCVAVCCSVLQ